MLEIQVGHAWTSGEERLQGPDPRTDSFVGFETGLLVNLQGERHAFGASLGGRDYPVGDDTGCASLGGPGFVVRGRYRHWLGNAVAAEASLGLVRGGSPKTTCGGRTAETAQVGLVVADQFSFTMDLDWVHESSTVTQFGIGIRFGGYTVPIFGLLALSAIGSGS